MKNEGLSVNTSPGREQPFGVSFAKSVAAVAITLALGGCLDDGHVHVVDTSGGDSEGGPAVEFGDEYWANLAVDFPEYFAPAGAVGDPGDEGSWEPLTDWPIIAAGAANMPDGKIMAWASWEVDGFALPAGQAPRENTHGVMYDPVTNSFGDRSSSTHDMFCSGASMLEDGSVFLAGGGQYVSSTSIFSDGVFSEIESLHQTRWYPTSTTLASGQVVTSLGNIQSPYSEIWTEGQGWDLMENVSLQNVLDETDYFYRDWYPALNVSPDGSLFHPGQMQELFSVDIEGDHDSSVHSHGNRTEDPALYNTTVMYDVGKILVAGGGYGENYVAADNVEKVDGYYPLKFSLATENAYTMDINGPEPVIAPTSPMSTKRTMQNSVVLPDGKVLVIGGTTEGVQFSNRNSVHYPEMWDPATGEWSLMAFHPTPRNYHSIAILLKDATVLSAGGGLCGACKSNHQNGRVFIPPYLYGADGELIARPSITGGDAEAYPGESIDIQGSDDITGFNMLRLVAITHHHSTDQRLIPTEFTKTAEGQYRLDLNSNANVLIPGYYWVFGLDQNGTPTSGHTVRVKVAPENEPPAAAAPVAKVAYEYFEGNLNSLALPDFDTLTPVKTGFIDEIKLSEKEQNSHYAFRFKGKVIVTTAGEHTFYLASDDGSKLFINGELIVDHDGPHGFESAEQSGSVTLTAGLHYIEVQYFEATGGDALLVSWETPTTPKRPMASEHFSDDVNTDPPPVEGVPGTIQYAYYSADSTELPDFEALTAESTGLSEGFDTSNRDRHEKYGFVFTAALDVQEEGDYTFYITSSGASSLSLDSTELVNNDGSEPQVAEEGIVTLVEAKHLLEVEFYAENVGDSLLVEWSGPNFTRQPIPLALLLDPSQADEIIDGGDDGAVDGGEDGAVDGGEDGAVDGGVDGVVDGGVDGAVDGGVDGGVDGAVDGGTDGVVDGSADGAVDGVTDGAADGGVDGAVDGGADGTDDGGADTSGTTDGTDDGGADTAGALKVATGGGGTNALLLMLLLMIGVARRMTGLRQ